MDGNELLYTLPSGEKDLREIMRITRTVDAGDAQSLCARKIRDIGGGVNFHLSVVVFVLVFIFVASEEFSVKHRFFFVILAVFVFFPGCVSTCWSRT